jgi:hypothetical protein
MFYSSAFMATTSSEIENFKFKVYYSSGSSLSLCAPSSITDAFMDEPPDGQRTADVKMKQSFQGFQPE